MLDSPLIHRRDQEWKGYPFKPLAMLALCSAREWRALEQWLVNRKAECEDYLAKASDLQEINRSQGELRLIRDLVSDIEQAIEQARNEQS